MIISTCEQRSEAWYDIRCGKITGTRFKTLMSGLSTKGFNDLVSDVVAEIITEQTEPTYTNEIMQRGIDLEPEAIKEYEHLFECDVSQVGFVEPDERFSGWIGVSPDGLVDDGMIEIKCPLAKTHLGYICNGKLPGDYVHQVQGQLYVTELNWCDFMSYYPGMKPFIIRVHPDKKMHDEFSERLNIFIEMVELKLKIYNTY